jgi:hypothetical protein
VLNAILDRESDFEVESGGEALSHRRRRFRQELSRLAIAASPKQAAVVPALGECRRTVAATTLAKLTKQQRRDPALVVVRAGHGRQRLGLGDAGRR